jgi:predicted RNA-binding protein YlxR (DUF448 family)
MGKEIKVRMCIVCRKRYAQKELIRLQFYKEKQEIVEFNGTGRSFYICKGCLSTQKLQKVFVRNFHLDKKKVDEQVKYLKGIYG